MDVSKKNFDSILPTVLSDINNASFIAVDTEFSALRSSAGKENSRSYFDAGDDLYNKEKENLENVSVIQIGISTFKFIPVKNTYLVNTYNFYTRPAFLLCINPNILFETSVIEFLKNFNFQECISGPDDPHNALRSVLNRDWATNGIPSLNAEDENRLRNHYAKVLSGEVDRDFSYEVRNVMGWLKKWVLDSEVGDSREVNLGNYTEILNFLSTLPSSGLNVCPSFEDNKVFVTVTPYPEEEKQKTEAERVLDIIIDQMKGVVKVIEALYRIDIPLIVHNGLLDIMLIYQQFHRSLPESYSEFKMSVHEVFPNIYDTKQLASVVKKVLKKSKDKELTKERLLANTNLKALKQDLETQMVVKFRPKITEKVKGPFSYKDSNSYHEAGYDAYATGYCFIHLCEIYANLCHFGNVKYQRPLSHLERIHAMKHWKNVLTVGISDLEYMVLDGSDQKKHFNYWWVVKSRNFFMPLNYKGVVSSLAKYGGGEAIKLNRNSALIRGYWKSRYGVIKAFSDNKHLKLMKYGKHSSKVGPLVWTWAILTTGLSTWLSLKSWKKELQ